MFFDRRLNITKMPFLPNLKHILVFNKILIMALTATSLRFVIISKLIWKGKRSKKIRKRKEVEICPIRNQDFSSAKTIKAVWHWSLDGQRNQWNKIESPEPEPWCINQDKLQEC